MKDSILQCKNSLKGLKVKFLLNIYYNKYVLQYLYPIIKFFISNNINFIHKNTIEITRLVICSRL